VYHNNFYTDSTDLADMQFIASDGVTVTVGEASGAGWSAAATHQGLPGESCAIFHGSATPVTPATVESQIACTR
ncbi:MAG TPA: hypothetical protein VFQ22_01005, partial [Longimicrobiales bacterium]|nr:hypothetical protein [Longimicrobiales bacterium]